LEPVKIKDFFKAKRYMLPEHWVLDPDSFFGMEYLGYLNIVTSIIGSEGKLYCLDVGCGDGRISFEIIKLGHNVTGFDYSQKALKYARCFVPEAKFLEYDLTDEGSFPFQGETFDLVLMIEVIEHLNPKHYKRILANIRRLLKRNGIFLITVPTKRLPRDKGKHYMHFTFEEISSYLKGAGFDIKKAIGNHGVPLFHYVLARIVSNPLYDIKIIRKLYAIFYRKYLVYSSLKNAGRYILKCNAV
jgi:SAM-dependent methyltransferase